MTKKLIALLLLILLAAVPAYAEETDETLLDKVIRISEDGEELLTLDEEELMDVVGIDPESYTDFAYLAGRDTSQGRELIVLLATDSETAEQVSNPWRTTSACGCAAPRTIIRKRTGP